MAPLLRLYPFKYRDPVSGTWIKSSYKATLKDIAAHYAEWMIAGEPEVHGNVAPASTFDPHHRWTDGAVSTADANAEVIGSGQLRALDSLSATLVATFLRRYVTWCARTRRYSAMNGAARLLRAVASLAHGQPASINVAKD